MNFLSQKIFSLFIVLFAITTIKAQTKVIHTGEPFVILQGIEVHIEGSLETTAPQNTNFLIGNNGAIFIKDSLINNGGNRIFGNNTQINSSRGKVVFNGALAQLITGLDTINLKQVEITNSTSVTVSQTITIDSTFDFILGNVLLDSGSINLGIDGIIVNENNNNRISGYPGVVYLNKAFPSGVTNNDISGIGLQTNFTGSTGNLEIIRVHIPLAGSANGSISRYYEITPTSNGGSVSFPGSNYFDSNNLINHDEDSLSVYISESNGNVWRDKGGIRNNVADNVLINSSSIMWQLDTASSNQTLITLADDSCHILPYLDIPKDTIPICSGGNAWIAFNGGSGLERIWSTGAYGVDSILVSTVGMYYITVIDANGCVNKDSVRLINSLDPSADFTINNNNTFCLGDSAIFTDSSSSFNSLHSYLWNFGDYFNTGNDTSSVASPTYTYSQKGTYTVTLTVTSDLGCTHSKTETIFVLPYPDANFLAPDLCNGNVVIFDNTSTLQNQDGIHYTWDFGDGSSNLTNLGSSNDSGGVYITTNSATTHTFTSNGSYTVQLIAEASGCSDTIIQVINIYPNPIANFVYTSACPNQDVIYSNTSTISSGSLTYLWDFGNGQNSTLNNPTQAFSNSGIVTTTLIVTSNNGCVDSISQNITIYTVPIPNYSFSNVCENEAFNFTNSTTDLLNNTYYWDFGDGNTSTSISPSNTYFSQGNYSVQLIATSNQGCIDSINQNITVYPIPVANFSAFNACEESQVNFSNTSTVSNGTFTSYWDLGNGNTSTLNNVTQIYSTSGSKNIKLVITSNQGCSDSIIQAIQIYALPIMNIGNNISTCGSSYILDAGNIGSSYFWSTGSTSQIIIASFSGNYNVMVTTPDGCIDLDTVSLTLNSSVAPNLGPDASFCDSVVLDADYPNATFLWNTGATTQLISTSLSGNYSVTIIDQNNCIGTDDINVVINSSPLVNIGGNQQSCVGQTVILDAGIHTSYLWNDNSLNQTLSVSASGTYSVEVSNAFGCTSIDSANITFNPLPIVDFGIDTAYCDSVTLNASNLGATYLWNDGSTDTILYINISGLYYCTATINNTGCVVIDSINIIINQSPIINLGADTVLCSYDSILLDATISSGTYLWNNGSINPLLLVNSSGFYLVNVTDNNNCFTSDSINIILNPLFVENIGNNFTLCAGQDAILSSTVANGTYSWNDNTGLISSNSYLNIDTAGIYWLDVIDSLGCVATDTIEIISSTASLFAQFLAQSTITSGDSISFINLSYPRPYTCYWQMGNGLILTDSTPDYVYYIPGDYDVVLAVNNTICTDTMIKTITVDPIKSEENPPEIYQDLYNGIVNAVLYPNPNEGYFNVNIFLEKEGEIEISIHSLMGQLLGIDKAVGKEVSRNYDFNNLESGMYIFIIRVGKQTKALKFIKL